MRKSVIAMCAILAGGAVYTAAGMVKPLEGPWLKPGETLVCFGDSITASEKQYIQYLRESLEPKGVKVVNAGVGGDKTPMALTRVRDVLEKKPDAVMLFFGANDSLIGRGCWRDEPKVSPEGYRDNLLWIIHYFRLKGVKKFSVVAPPGCCEGKSLLEFGYTCPPYAGMAREAADQMNAVPVSLDIAFAVEQSRSSESPMALNLTRDGVHFSEKGSRLAAETMLKAWNMDK